MNCLDKKSYQKFKVGDWFVLDMRSGALRLKKVKPQKVINIKLGIKNVLNHNDFWFIRKIVKINGNKIYYNLDEMMTIRR